MKGTFLGVNENSASGQSQKILEKLEVTVPRRDCMLIRDSSFISQTRKHTNQDTLSPGLLRCGDAKERPA